MTIPSSLRTSQWSITWLTLAFVAANCVTASHADGGANQNNVASESTAAPKRQLLELGPGDSIAIQVYGQPDMTTTVEVADDGTIAIPLAGAIVVKGQSPAQTARQIEKVLRDRNLLVDPNVNVTIVQSRSQRVTVLGEVRAPGQFPIESNTTVLDLLARAGGTTENSSQVVYLLRTEQDGAAVRLPIQIEGPGNHNLAPTQKLQGGDSLLVPRADQFSIIGEVRTPNMYRFEPGMTMMQAIALAGGVSAIGSLRRIEIKRRGADGKFLTLGAKLTDEVQANDVIRIKESIF